MTILSIQTGSFTGSEIAADAADAKFSTWFCKYANLQNSLPKFAAAVCTGQCQPHAAHFPYYIAKAWRITEVFL
jgi:hypothetical protein